MALIGFESVVRVHVVVGPVGGPAPAVDASEIRGPAPLAIDPLVCSLVSHGVTHPRVVTGTTWEIALTDGDYNVRITVAADSRVVHNAVSGTMVWSIAVIDDTNFV